MIPAPFPVFQSDSIRATVGQLGVASDNSRVGLSVTIENISTAAVYLALQGANTGDDRYRYPSLELSDDRATEWRLHFSYSELPYEISGIQTLPYGYTTAKQADFTAIAPSERITVVMNFERLSGGNTPGTTFSFAAQGTFYTSSGLKSVSIGFPRIPVGQQPVQANPTSTLFCTISGKSSPSLFS